MPNGNGRPNVGVARSPKNNDWPPQQTRMLTKGWYRQAQQRIRRQIKGGGRRKQSGNAEGNRVRHRVPSSIRELQLPQVCYASQPCILCVCVCVFHRLSVFRHPSHRFCGLGANCVRCFVIFCACVDFTPQPSLFLLLSPFLCRRWRTLGRISRLQEQCGHGWYEM